jgi:hypothetical protein
MQGKFETSEDFLRRTDELAVRLGIGVQELPDLLGFSRASLFAYRAGKRPITAKAWLKLVAVEKTLKPEKAASQSESTKKSHGNQYEAKPFADDDGMAAHGARIAESIAMADAAGGASVLDLAVDEIRVRMIQFPHASPAWRKKLVGQAQARVQEFADWCAALENEGEHTK